MFELAISIRKMQPTSQLGMSMNAKTRSQRARMIDLFIVKQRELVSGTRLLFGWLRLWLTPRHSAVRVRTALLGFFSRRRRHNDSRRCRRCAIQRFTAGSCFRLGSTARREAFSVVGPFRHALLEVATSAASAFFALDNGAFANFPATRMVPSRNGMEAVRT